MAEKDFKKLIEEARGLPALGSVVTKVMTAVVEETSARDIAEMIERDSSVTGRILKVINSSFYGLSGHISTVSQAVPLLGIQVVKNIVLTFSVLDIFPRSKEDGFDFQKLWEHSFATASAAKLLAKETGYEDPEEALVAGLLHDIGVLILAKHGLKEYMDVRKRHDETGKPVIELEREILGITHPELGALLAEKWKLPDILIIPVRYHHHEILPREMHSQARLLTNIIHVADVMCEVFSVSASREQILKFRTVAQERLALPDKTLVGLLAGVTREIEQVAQMFMVAAPRSYIEILEEAHLELGRLNLAYLMEKQATV
jgi:putative nucleotidyltransferase with HDIG domain